MLESIQGFEFGTTLESGRDMYQQLAGSDSGRWVVAFLAAIASWVVTSFAKGRYVRYRDRNKGTGISPNIKGLVDSMLSPAVNWQLQQDKSGIYLDDVTIRRYRNLLGGRVFFMRLPGSVSVVDLRKHCNRLEYNALTEAYKVAYARAAENAEAAYKADLNHALVAAANTATARLPKVQAMPSLESQAVAVPSAKSAEYNQLVDLLLKLQQTSVNAAPAVNAQSFTAAVPVSSEPVQTFAPGHVAFLDGYGTYIKSAADVLREIRDSGNVVRANMVPNAILPSNTIAVNGRTYVLNRENSNVKTVVFNLKS